MERKITLVAFMMATIFSIGLTSIPFSFADISIDIGENFLTIDKGTSDDPSPFLRKVNPDTGVTIELVEVIVGGEDVLGGKGLAFNPVDGKLYALIKIDNGGPANDIFLATLNPETGVATLIDDTLDKYQAIAFNSAGDLFGAVANNGNDFNTLQSMSIVDASTTELCDLDGFSGRSLAFNPVDGFLYHYNVDVGLQRIVDTTTGAGNPCGSIDIPTTEPTEFSTALTFRTQTGVFLMGVDGTDLFTLSAAGTGPDFVGSIDVQPRGFAIILVDDIPIGGTYIPIDQTALLLAGVQSISMWMIPVVVAAIGIGVFVIKRRK